MGQLLWSHPDEPSSMDTSVRQGRDLGCNQRLGTQFRQDGGMQLKGRDPFYANLETFSTRTIPARQFAPTEFPSTLTKHNGNCLLLPALFSLSSKRKVLARTLTTWRARIPSL